MRVSRKKCLNGRKSEGRKKQMKGEEGQVVGSRQGSRG